MSVTPPYGVRWSGGSGRNHSYSAQMLVLAGRNVDDSLLSKPFSDYEVVSARTSAAIAARAGTKWRDIAFSDIPLI